MRWTSSQALAESHIGGVGSISSWIARAQLCKSPSIRELSLPPPLPNMSVPPFEPLGVELKLVAGFREGTNGNRPQSITCNVIPKDHMSAARPQCAPASNVSGARKAGVPSELSTRPRRLREVARCIARRASASARSRVTTTPVGVVHVAKLDSDIASLSPPFRRFRSPELQNSPGPE